MAVNVTASEENCEASWDIWCSECKAEVYVDTYKKLREAVDYVRRVEGNKGRAAASSAASATASKATAAQKPSSKSGSRDAIQFHVNDVKFHKNH